MKLKYTVFLTPIPEGFHVSVPDLPSVFTFGSTVDEALDMTQDAIGVALLTMEDLGETLPAPSPADDLINVHEGIPAIISVDTLRYRMQTDTRAVRKNVSMPAWMAHQVEVRNINCSQVLQDALRTKLEDANSA